MLPHDTLLGGTVVITGVAPGSPAQQAGLRRGDAILSVGGERVLDVEDLVDAVKANAGRPVALNLRRGGLVAGLGSSPEFAVYETVEVVPREIAPDLRVVEEVGDPASEVSLAEARRYDSGLEIGDILTQRFIGVMIGLTNVRVGKTTDPVWVASPKSFVTIWDILVFTKNGVVEGLTTGSNPGIAGPVGIAQATGEVVDRLGISWVFQLTALLSVSLAVVNLLPIPALDGGRLMFVVIEWARRGKRISPQREGLAHLVGFVIVIGFLVFFTYQDVLRILSGESMVP
jgi:regulator of sigma E protease